MARLALCSTLALVTATPAAADVVVGADVPFSTPELTSALSARGVAPREVAVRLMTPTTVELRTPDGSQRVELGAAKGPAAARLVALHLAETGAAIELPAAVAAPRRASSWQLEVASGAGRGVAEIDLTLVATRVGVVRTRGRWRWGGSVAWLHGLAEAADPTQPVAADLGIVRAVAGVAVGPFEIVAGPALVGYRVGTAASGVGLGAGGGIRTRLAGNAHWRAVAGIDLDGFRHRVVVELDGLAFAATPRVAVTAALGLVWEGP